MGRYNEYEPGNPDSADYQVTAERVMATMDAFIDSCCSSFGPLTAMEEVKEITFGAHYIRRTEYALATRPEDLAKEVRLETDRTGLFGADCRVTAVDAVTVRQWGDGTLDLTREFRRDLKKGVDLADLSEGERQLLGEVRLEEPIPERAAHRFADELPTVLHVG